LVTSKEFTTLDNNSEDKELRSSKSKTGPVTLLTVIAIEH